MADDLPPQIAAYRMDSLVDLASASGKTGVPDWDSGCVTAHLYLRLSPLADGQPGGVIRAQIFLSPDHATLPLSTLRRSARSRLAQTLRDMSAALDSLPNEDGQDWSLD